MINKTKTVCFSGHRTEKLPTRENGLGFLRLELFDEIEKAIESGFDTFIFGGCYGFDLLCAQMVLLHKFKTKQSESDIKLIAAVPFKGQELKWSDFEKEKYYDVIEKCDDVIMLSEKYSFDSYRKRNRFMVDNSALIVCYYNGQRSGTGYTVKYAQKQGLDVINLYQ